MSTETLPNTAETPRVSGAPALGVRAYVLTAISLAALAVLIPPVQLALYAAAAAIGYGVSVSPLSRNQKLALVLASLAVFLYLVNQVRRPSWDWALWGGFGIEVFFVLRMIDYAVSPHRKLLAGSLRDRIAQYLLYLFFLPTLLSGPTATFSDFFKSYAPTSGRGAQSLLRNGLLIAWGAIKFYVLSEPLLNGAHRLLEWGSSSATPYAWLDPHLCLWGYVCVWMVWFYFTFSGFTNMAVGVSRLLGFQLYANFEDPFLASDPGDYWKRWNVSGRKWLIKHVFYPYWGHGQITRKVMTTFWASGLWHLAVAVRVNLDAALQLFAAVTVYGAAVALVAALEQRSGWTSLAARFGRLGGWTTRGAMIAFTFLFTAVIHQVFWAGMLGRPVGEVIGLMKGLFWLT